VNNCVVANRVNVKHTSFCRECR